MLQNKFLITHGCVHILSLIPQNNTFWCLGQHSQTITGFKTKFLTMNGKNSITSDCIVLMFKSAKI